MKLSVGQRLIMRAAGWLSVCGPLIITIAVNLGTAVQTRSQAVSSSLPPYATQIVGKIPVSWNKMYGAYVTADHRVVSSADPSIYTVLTPRRNVAWNTKTQRYETLDGSPLPERFWDAKANDYKTAVYWNQQQLCYTDADGKKVDSWNVSSAGVVEARPNVIWSPERQQYVTLDGSPMPWIKDAMGQSGIPAEAIDPTLEVKNYRGDFYANKVWDPEDKSYKTPVYWDPKQQAYFSGDGNKLTSWDAPSYKVVEPKTNVIWDPNRQEYVMIDGSAVPWIQDARGWEGIPVEAIDPYFVKIADLEKDILSDIKRLKPELANFDQDVKQIDRDLQKAVEDGQERFARANDDTSKDFLSALNKPAGRPGNSSQASPSLKGPQSVQPDCNYFLQQARACRAGAANENAIAAKDSVEDDAALHRRAAQAYLNAAAQYDAKYNACISGHP